MKTFLIFCCLFLVISAEIVSKDFDSFKRRFDKSYKTAAEDLHRQKVFEENVDYINKHNLEANDGKHTFTLGINEYTDLSNDEWKKYLLGYQVSGNRESVDEVQSAEEDLPTSVDWRTKGYVTEVKNQGHCGSCWAFSATGSMEGAWFKKTNKLVSLSEQNIVDCDKKSNACKGGSMQSAYQYVMSTGGDDTEESYPYKGVVGPCKFTKSDIGASITSFKSVKQNDENALLKDVANVGPVSVAIDASQPSFHHYMNGTYYDEKCSSKKLDHGVLVVGYGSEDDNGGDYWIVKNSWGASWGMDGYIHMSRNKDNNCGIATDASYPIA